MIRKTDTVYISGPMTGLPFFNYFRFYAVAGLIAKEYGCEVLNPARHRDGMPYQFYMDCAVDDLKHATAIVLLDGWEKSRGANFELDTAAKNGIQRIISQTDLLLDIERRMRSRNPQLPAMVEPKRKPTMDEIDKATTALMRAFVVHRSTRTEATETERKAE